VACEAALFDRLGRDLRQLTRRDASALTPVIAACCRIKGAVVAADERESGARRVLNFGHTVGHALEAVTKYRRLLHGERSPTGCWRPAGSQRRAAPCAADTAAVAGLIAQLGPLPPLNDLPAAALLEYVPRDKKVSFGRLHFVLPTGIGSVRIVDDVGEPELLRALREIGLGE